MAMLGWLFTLFTAVWTVFLLIIGHAAVMAAIAAVRHSSSTEQPCRSRAPRSRPAAPPPGARRPVDPGQGFRIQREAALAGPGTGCTGRPGADCVGKRAGRPFLVKSAGDPRLAAAAHDPAGVVATGFLTLDDGAQLGRDRSKILLVLGLHAGHEVGTVMEIEEVDPRQLRHAATTS